MSETPFELIKKEHVPGGLVRMSYGSSKDDPLPFILTLTPEWVARKTDKHIATIVQGDMDDYVVKNGRDLRLTAVAVKATGLTTAVLE